MTGTILTAVGKAKIASATPEAQLQITHVAVGDGNGSYPVLTENMVALANEVWRGTSSNPIRDVQATNTLMFESAIPPDIGGFTIREIAIFDVDGDMIAIGHVDPAQVKPLPTTTTAVNMTVRMIIALANAEQTNLVLSVAPVVTHNGLADRDVVGAHPASAILNSSGVDQQKINDFGGALWWPKPGGYEFGATVKLENGDIVRSTAAGNTTDPNTNMTGWFNEADFVKKKTLSLKDFGAIEGEDVSTAFKAMVNYINANADVQHIDISGIYTTSEPLDFKLTAALPALRTASWAFQVTATVAMPYVMHFDCPFVECSGYAKGYGHYTNQLDWDTYGSDHIFTTGHTYEAKLPKLHTAYAKLWGVRYLSDGLNNSNIYARYPKVISRYCGGSNVSSDFNNLPAISATFTKGANSGGSGAYGQYTTITVSQLPFPAEYLEKVLLFCVINGKTYRVRNWDALNNQLGLFPWLPDSVTSGEIKYFFGGGCRNEGPNASGAAYNVNSRNCAIGFEDAGLYGSNIEYINAEYCTVGVVAGFGSGGTKMSIVNGAYTEAVYRNLLNLNASMEVYGRTGLFAGASYVNCERLTPAFVGQEPAYADALRWSDVRMPPTSLGTVTGIYEKGKVKGYENNDAIITLSPARLPHVFKRDSLTVNLADPTQINLAGGFDDAFLTVFGPSVRFIPEGTITFNPPVGWTVNGKTTVTFSRFSQVPNFKILWDIPNLNCIVVYDDIKNTLQSTRTRATRGSNLGQAVTTITINSSVGTGTNSGIMSIKAIGNGSYVDMVLGVSGGVGTKTEISNNSTSGVAAVQTGTSDAWQVVITIPSTTNLVCDVEVVAGGHSSAQFATNPTIALT